MQPENKSAISIERYTIMFGVVLVALWPRAVTGAVCRGVLTGDKSEVCWHSQGYATGARFVADSMSIA